MRRMNNKGFAVSTLLYGILIMVFLLIFALMSTLGTTRKNTKNLTSKIEEELNNYAATNVTMMNDSSIDNPRTYITPSAGWYKIELWGSKYTYNSSNLGYYTSGMIYLKENDHLYIHLGQNNVDDKDSYISLTEDEASIIMLASGGPISGGHGHYIINGYAGTEVDNGGKIDTAKRFEIEYGQYDENGNAELSDVYPVFYDGLAVPNVSNSNGKFRIQKVSNNDEDNPPRKDTNTKLNNVRYIRDCATGNSDNSHNGKYPHDVHWVELQAIVAGKNIALNKNVEVSPTFTLKGSGAEVITDGKASDSSKYGTYVDSDGTVGEKCITLDLGQTYNLDEVAVWHYYYDGRNYYNHKLLVSSDKTNWTSLRETRYWTTPCGANGTSTCRYSTGEIETSLDFNQYHIMKGHLLQQT